jgi:hypothetical protein
MRYLAFLLLSISLVSCKKKEVLLTNQGIITGINPCQYACLIDCPCACGNYLFHFTNSVDTSNIVIDNREIFQFPTNTQFPVRITLDWQNTTRCGIQSIKVLNYKSL